MPSTAQGKPLLVAVAVLVLAGTASDALPASLLDTTSAISSWSGAALDLAREGYQRGVRGIAEGYARRPAIMIGVAVGVLIPVLAVVGWLLHHKLAGTLASTKGHDAASLAPNFASARIEIDGASAIELPQERSLVQIGRHDDNDICLSDEAVERYHAVIEHNPIAGFTITDVSDPAGEGIKVNGQRRVRAVLVDGDTVELGRSKLRFAAAA